VAKASLERIVVVGGSLSGLRAAQSLRGEGYAGDLTIVAEEEHLPYDRPPLSKELLAGTIEPERLDLGGARVDARWLLGRRATALDLDRRHVTLVDGEQISFDGLVIATGAVPRQLRIKHRMDGVFTLRTIDDCLALRRALETGRPRVVVVGAGFIGSEVASTCRALGLEVAVVEPAPAPLQPLGPTLGGVCADLQRAAQVDLRLGRSVIGLDGVDRLERVRLDDGTNIAADVAVVAIGVSPATGWLEGSGLVLQDGVVCDETSSALGVKNVVAAGDVARWPNVAFGGAVSRVEHWSNAVEQGIAAASSLLAGRARAQAYAPVPSFWSQQFGVKIQSLGMPQLADSWALIEGSVEARCLVMLFGKEQRVVGAVTFDSSGRLAAIRKLIVERASFDASVRALSS
jgi:3-phenylpropionate/trans-cinnamate dioxygenase ferredoxin reductase subunit